MNKPQPQKNKELKTDSDIDIGPLPEFPNELKGVLALTQISRADVASVGNKAAMLGELCAAGLPVTPGLVICAQSCRGLQAARCFTPELLEELELKLDEHWPDCTSFAVRTSAVEGLRAAEQNLRDTRCEYFVSRDALPVAIIAAAAAAGEQTAQAGDPASKATGSAEFVKRAVLLQPMVHARVSGTLFAGALQAGAADSYLIEACWGLGRALAEGQTDPDRYQLDRDNLIIERTRGRKQHQLKPQGSGLLVAVAEEDRLAWTLDDDQLRQITALAKRCASVLGCTQDIEFSLADEGIVALQSKPVTSATLAPENVPPGEWLIYLPQLENFAEPFTPLAEDLLQRVLPDFARLIHGRIYLNLKKLSARLPVTASSAQLTQALLYQQDLANLPLRVSKVLRNIPFWLSRAPWAIVFWRRSRSLTRTQMDRFWKYADALALDTDLDARQLFERFVRGRSAFSAPWRLPFVVHATSSRYLFYMALLQRLVNRWADRELEDSTLQQLCTSNADTHSFDMVSEIAELGRRVAQTPELSAAFSTPLNAPGLHKLMNFEACGPFVQEFSAFVQRFGHRGTSELEIASTRWLEEPDALLALIGIASKQYSQKSVTGYPDGYGLQLLARDDLHQAIKSRWRRRVVDYLLRRIRYYVSQRENARHYASRALFLVRSRVLALEDRLLREKKLEKPGDVFFLSWNDIGYLDSGQLSVADARTLIAAAKDQHAERCTGKLKWALGYDPSPDPETSEPTDCSDADTDSDVKSPEPTVTQDLFSEALDVVQGRCAAPGSHEGIARVILSERDLADFKPGEVLVLAVADPTMAAAVKAAGAVVCERGSALSPLSALAREWGIPFVIGANNCTRAIATGERVRVSANIGRIDILPPEV